MPSVTYHLEREVAVQEDQPTILSVSLAQGIPHTHACGGKARCSTCRVLVLEHPENLSPPTTAEADLAARKGFEPNLRLACQARVCGDVRIRRLVRDEADVALALAGSRHTTGREARVAVLFSDIRGFTTFSERQDAYDVVHTLNRYLYHMGECILRNAGHIDKYMGDGIMALFGLDGGEPADICASAVRAGVEMLCGLEGLNEYLVSSFGYEYRLSIGIGVHYGDVILGEFGHPQRTQFTALGDAVNVAARLESATKTLSGPLVVSEAVHALIGDRVPCDGPFETTLKGKREVQRAYVVLDIDQACAWIADSAARRLDDALAQVVTRQTGPQFLRLAFHDACTWDPASGLGGANGSIRLPEELGRPENRGLEGAVARLGEVKALLPEVSWADLIALAGARAVTQAGGPPIPVALGRIDADGPDPPSRLTFRDVDLPEMLQSFAALGFTHTNVVALLGAHTFGKVDGMPFTDDLFAFSNSYFRLLLAEDGDSRLHLLPCDHALVNDPECLALVRHYAADEAAFHYDFAAAYGKMAGLGTGLGG